MDDKIRDMSLALLDALTNTYALLWDESGQILWANGAARQLLEIGRPEQPVDLTSISAHPLIASALEVAGPSSATHTQTDAYDIQIAMENGRSLLIGIPIPVALNDELISLYQHIASSSTDMVAVVGKDLRYLAANNDYAGRLGFKADDIAGLSLERLLNPELAATVATRIKFALQGQTNRYEDHAESHDGTPIILAIQYSPFWYFGDKITAVIISMRDVTREKKASEAIRESEYRYRELVNSMTNGVAVYEVIGDGEDFIFQDLNPAGCRLGNLERSQVVGHSVTEIYPGIRKMGLFEAFQRVYRTGKTEQVPLTMYEDSRITQWVDNIIYRLPNGNIVAIYEDVTDRMMTLESLNIRDRALASATNAIIICEARDDMPIVYVNAAFEAMTEYTASEVLGKNARFLQSLDRNQPEIATIWAALRKGEPSEVTLRNYTKNGRGFLAKIAISPVVNKAGQLTHFVGIQEDVTEATKLQEELLQAQKMEALGQLSSDIAHDFNNVLASMMGFTDLALRLSRQSQAPKVLNYLENVLEGGRRAQALVEQLLVYSRPQTNSDELNDLGPELTEIANLLKSSLPASISIDFSIEEDLPKAKIQAIQFHQILMNLALNARDAMEGRGELGIALQMREFTHEECTICHADLRGRWLVLSVSDNGTGIDPAEIGAIFEPFHTTKEPGLGTGLGLSVTHRIAWGQGGHILVESELGKGSTFHVLLPSQVSDAEVEAEEQESNTITEGEEEHILVVDDERALTEYLTELLLTSGYRATAVNSAREAAALLAEKPDDYDLLIADQTMPDLSGTELIATARHTAPDLPVILCTGNSQQIQTEDLDSGKVDLLLNKPVYGDYLLAQVQELLKKHKHKPRRV